MHEENLIDQEGGQQQQHLEKGKLLLNCYKLKIFIFEKWGKGEQKSKWESKYLKLLNGMK